MLFFRSTNNPVKDLENSQSYHQSDYMVDSINWLEDGQTEIEFVADSFGCDTDSIEVIDGYYVQVLNGLCGYELESDNLEDAIEELNEMDLDNIDCISPDNIYIFEGEESSDLEFVVEGTLFDPEKILGKF